MFKSTCQHRSFLTLPDLNSIARKTGLLVRQSAKFTPAALLQTLISSVVTGFASLNQLADCLKSHTHQAMSRQSFHERLSHNAIAFLLTVLQELIQQRFQESVIILQHSPIQRILVEDSSFQAMPKNNADIFPAHGNHHGATAGIKVDFTFDLLTGKSITHTLHAATEQDKTIGKESLTHLQPGDLVLRDMGYFSLSEFHYIQEKQAYWLTRLPLNVGANIEENEGSSTLENTLKRSKHDLIDTEVRVGQESIKCSLIAVRAAPEVATSRRAQRRKKAKESGKTPCPQGLIRDGWHLMLTNLSTTEAKASQLVAVYRARWAVEIQFRAWKQSLNLNKALQRKSNEHHMQALMLAAMIAHQLGTRIAMHIASRIGRATISYEKLYDILAAHLVKARDLTELTNFDPDPRHIKRDNRNRKSPIESGITALT